MFSKSLFTTASLVVAASAFPTLSFNQLFTRATGGVVSGPPANPLSYPGGADQGGSLMPFSGDGSTGAGWPSREQWMSFDAMWSKNLNRMHGYGPNNSEQELTDLRGAILQVSGEAQVDPRFILAIVLQESNGCVRVRTTGNVNSGIFNPGLMQDHSGTNSCNNQDNTAPVTPCPGGTILGMIRDGTSGTAAGDGIAQCINQGFSMGLSGNDVDSTQAFYRAARIYNSGSITNINDLNQAAPGTTAAYVNEVANRLVGWLGH